MSRIGFFQSGDRELIIVNNGKQPCEKDYAHIPNLVVVSLPENKGWEGGLREGLKVAKGEFICFQNDDVHIPQSDPRFYDTLMETNVDVVAPITTCAAGIQSIFHQNTPVSVTEVSMLIFLCVVIKKEALNAAGGIDDTLPGGDDLDLSIRMRLAGKRLFVNPNAFIVHHGMQTGNRVKGDFTVDGGWNSEKMQDNTNKALIQKHGFRTWMETMRSQIV
jgi:GT2 family glycosyltransferase